MTPKEKAEEIYTRYDSLFKAPFKTHQKLKECALIAVDELIKATETVWFLDGNYWEEVKQEIEKL